MMSRYKKMVTGVLAVGMAGLGMAIVVAAPSAYAGPKTLPAGTVVTGNLETGTNMTFKGDIDSVAVTVTCTTFTASGKVPAGTPKKVNLSKPPTIKGCTDTLGGHDTITTNQTNGKWSLSITGKASAYKMILHMPKAGATFKSSILSSCVITAAPTKAVSITGSYDGNDTDTVTNAPIATSGSGCTSTTATTSAIVVLSPAPGPPPF
jgi:hypothetical protein